MDADRSTLLDLIAAIGNNRRCLEYATLRPGDAAQHVEYHRALRRQTAAVSRITRDLARHDKRHTSLPSRKLDVYINNLLEVSLGVDIDPDKTGAVRRTR